MTGKLQSLEIPEPKPSLLRCCWCRNIFLTFNDAGTASIWNAKASKHSKAQYSIHGKIMSAICH